MPHIDSLKELTYKKVFEHILENGLEVISENMRENVVWSLSLLTEKTCNDLIDSVIYLLKFKRLFADKIVKLNPENDIWSLAPTEKTGDALVDSLICLLKCKMLSADRILKLNNNDKLPGVFVELNSFMDARDGHYSSERFALERFAMALGCDDILIEENDSVIRAAIFDKLATHDNLDELRENFYLGLIALDHEIQLDESDKVHTKHTNKPKLWCSILQRFKKVFITQDNYDWLQDIIFSTGEVELAVLDAVCEQLEAANINNRQTWLMVAHHRYPLASAQQVKALLDAITKQFNDSDVDVQIQAQLDNLRRRALIPVPICDVPWIGYDSTLRGLEQSKRAYDAAKTNIQDAAIWQLFGDPENSLDQTEQITAAIHAATQAIEASNENIKKIEQEKTRVIFMEYVCNGIMFILFFPLVVLVLLIVLIFDGVRYFNPNINDNDSVSPTQASSRGMRG